jgi:hypothetical protein
VLRESRFSHDTQEIAYLAPLGRAITLRVIVYGEGFKRKKERILFSLKTFTHKTVSNHFIFYSEASAGSSDPRPELVEGSEGSGREKNRNPFAGLTQLALLYEVSISVEIYHDSGCPFRGGEIDENTGFFVPFYVLIPNSGRSRKAGDYRFFLFSAFQ